MPIGHEEEPLPGNRRARTSSEEGFYRIVESKTGSVVPVVTTHRSGAPFAVSWAPGLRRSAITTVVRSSIAHALPGVSAKLPRFYAESFCSYLY